MSRPSPQAFTLLEVLVMLLLVAALSVLLFSALSDSQRGVALKASGDALGRMVWETKQLAALRNRPQDLRWFRWKENENWRMAVARFEGRDDGGWEMVGGPWYLPQDLALLPDESDLFAMLPKSESSPLLPSAIPSEAEAISWILFPSGKTQILSTSSVGSESSLTLVPADVSPDLAKSRRLMIFLDPRNGSFRFLQP